MVCVASISLLTMPIVTNAEEIGPFAQITTKTGPTVAPAKPKLDCKWTEEKAKDGKITYKLTGKECEKLEQDVNSQ